MGGLLFKGRTWNDVPVDMDGWLVAHDSLRFMMALIVRVRFFVSPPRSSQSFHLSLRSSQSLLPAKLSLSLSPTLSLTHPNLSLLLCHQGQRMKKGGDEVQRKGKGKKRMRWGWEQRTNEKEERNAQSFSQVDQQASAKGNATESKRDKKREGSVDRKHWTKT